MRKGTCFKRGFRVISNIIKGRYRRSYLNKMSEKFLGSEQRLTIAPPIVAFLNNKM